MIAIYEPKGKAAEYEKYACNLYKGCGHGCTYCYAPAVTRRDRDKFFKEPQPRQHIIDELRKDAKKLGDRYKSSVKHWDIYHNPSNQFGNFGNKQKPTIPFIFLCFTCDPYQPINQKYQLTRQAIEILHENGLGVNILTKGKITDFDLLAKNPHLSKVGVTLTGGEKEHEQNAIDIDKRLRNIETAMMYKIKTWISFEPVISPSLVLFYIKLYYQRFVQLEYHNIDEFKIGKWNYSKEADKIDWYKFTNDAIKLLKDLGCNYYIKSSLRKYIK